MKPGLVVGPGRGVISTVAIFGLLALVPAALSAQQGQGAQGQGAQGQDPAQADTVQLVFERERFTYPTFQRRNPFRALTGQESGPRFEELTFRGAILSSREGGSVALLTAPGGGPVGRNFRVREGQVLGNVRIISIERRQVVVNVDEFGQVERRVLELRRTEPQAQPGSDNQEQTDTDPDSTGTGGAGADPDTTGGSGLNGSGGST